MTPQQIQGLAAEFVVASKRADAASKRADAAADKLQTILNDRRNRVAFNKGWESFLATVDIEDADYVDDLRSNLRMPVR